MCGSMIVVVVVVVVVCVYYSIFSFIGARLLLL